MTLIRFKNAVKYGLIYAAVILVGAVMLLPFVGRTSTSQPFSKADKLQLKNFFFGIAFADHSGGGGAEGGDTGGDSGGDGGGCGCGGNCCGNCEGGQAGCFSAGTQVLMADGSTKAIEAVVVGDEVQSFDEDGNLTAAKVVDTKVHEDSNVVSVNGVTTTPDHRFLTNNGFKKTGELAEGDVLVGAEGNAIPAAIETMDQKITTFNLEVAETHTYIAGGFRVHNWK